MFPQNGYAFLVMNKTLNPLGIFPFVTIEIKDPAANWFGMFTINCGANDAKKLGAPWKTKEEAQNVAKRLNKAIGLGDAIYE